MSSLRTILMSASAEFIPQLHTPTYTITPNITAVNEGGTVTYTIRTTYVNNGTTLYWTTSGGAVAADFADNAVDGSVTIMGQKATFTRVLAGDLTTEGVEGFQIRVRTDSINGTVVASAANVDINDTSVPVGPTYAFAAAAASVNEGSSITYTVTTSGVADGTTLFYTLTGTAGILDITGGTLNGTVTITGGTGTVTVATVADTTTEGNETIIAQLRTTSISGTVVATAGTVTVNDTSTAPVPTYSVSASTTNVNEGGSVTVTVTTTDVANGTTLYWSTAGSVAAADFGDNVLTGSFTVTGGTGSFVRNIVSDTVTEGGEAMTFSIRTSSVVGTVVGTTATITVNDTSTTPVGYGPDEIVVKLTLDPSGASGGDTTVYMYSIKPNTTPCIVYWGDGTTSTYSANTNYTSHDYGTDTGTFIVRIKNAKGVTLPSYWHDIIQFSNIPLISMAAMFSEAAPTVDSPFTCGTQLPDTSACIDFQLLFRDRADIANNLDISNMNVSAGQVFWGMFRGTTGVTKNISGWDVSQGQNFGIMFENSNYAPDITGWNMGNALRLYGTFMYNSAFNRNISGWNVSKVWDMHFMFFEAFAFNQDLSNWCVGIIPWEPTAFDTKSPDNSIANPSWTSDKKPIWGACPSGIIVPPAAARATPDNNYVNEGDTVTFSVETRNVANGTTVYWTVSGDAADFDSSLSGSFTSTGATATLPGTGTVYVDVSADGFDDGGEEYFGLQFFLVQGGTRIGYSDGVTISDTSL